jgi:hypothetical protein
MEPSTSRAVVSRSFVVGLLFLAGAVGSVWAQSPPASNTNNTGGEAFFEKKIRLLLAERCYGCHSARAAKLRGGLHLDSRKGIIAGGDSGPVIVPGSPERSRLIQAVRYTNPDLRMPPKKALAANEVADLETWVKQGAPMPLAEAAAAPMGDARLRKHWAFEPVKEPPLPSVKQVGWVKNPIDDFILAGLERKGLSPAAPVDKRTLLRRATYDLTGLPPTPEEVDAFLSDDSPEAFARVVDRLLASPGYGERWGRHWLDLVRYTDDFEEAWRYRDWVVAAFNDDLPYNQFIIRQIAGDRLPAPSPPLPPGEGKSEGQLERVNADGIIATTMLSLGPWGGIDRRKRMADIVDDQIDTIGRGFLGLTLACARCHDHKFDPIPTADYYGLAGIFYSSRVISDSVYLSHGTTRLHIPLVPACEVARHREHMARVREQEKKLQTAVEQQYAAFARSLLPQTALYLLSADDYQHQPSGQGNVAVEEFASRRGLQGFALSQWVNYLQGSPLGDFRLLHVPVRDYDGEAGVQVWGASAERPWWGVNTTNHEVPIETWLLPPGSVSINPGVEGGAVGWKSPFTGKVRIQGKLTDADPHDGTGVTWMIDQATAEGRRELSSGTLPNGGVLKLEDGRTTERLASVSVKTGDMIYLQIWLQQGDAHYDITNVDFTLTRLDGPGQWDLARDARSYLAKGNPHRDGYGNAAWHYFDMAGSNRRPRMPAVEPHLARWQKVASEVRSGMLDRKALDRAAWDFQQAITSAGPDSPLVQDLVGVRSPFWVNGRDDGKYLPARAREALSKLQGELDALKASTPPLPCAHGVQEGGPRFSLFSGIQDAQIHIRGRYDQLGKRVPRHFPAVLGGASGPPITSGSGRLELARWIASPDNPLTARVMVNRIWQHHFGDGIVRTPSNFGQLGARPTHPELLDWLARRFVASGWSVKAMHRLILLSAAYQQSSKPPAATLRADPDNLSFGRMNRRRLEAEALRDSILVICHRLDSRRGGPAADDAQSPRRMLYLKCSRSDRSGFGALFDAANASMHVEKRTASTVAPQALFLMNGPLLLDGVHHLVGSDASQAQPRERVQALYRSIYGRKPTAAEIELGCRFVASQAAEAPAPAAADGSASLAPWETYAQALLLSNELLFMD